MWNANYSDECPMSSTYKTELCKITELQVTSWDCDEDTIEIFFRCSIGFGVRSIVGTTYIEVDYARADKEEKRKNEREDTSFKGKAIESLKNGIVNILIEVLLEQRPCRVY